MEGGLGACRTPGNIVQMGGKQPPRALLPGMKGGGEGWTEVLSGEKTKKNLSRTLY